jgi:hypothetical protein
MRAGSKCWIHTAAASEVKSAVRLAVGLSAPWLGGGITGDRRALPMLSGCVADAALTIVSSNASVQAWGKVLGNRALVASMVDRLMGRVHVVSIGNGSPKRGKPRLHPWQVVPTRAGIGRLGFRILPGQMRVKRTSVVRARKRLQRLLAGSRARNKPRDQRRGSRD